MMTTTGTETVTATGGSLIGVTKQHLIFSLTTITPPPPPPLRCYHHVCWILGSIKGSRFEIEAINSREI